jgi:hypothetical protein
MTDKGGYVMELFDDTFIPPGLRDVWAGTHHCPRCVWPYLQPVASHDQSHWLCPSCGHCYYLVHGHLRTVDPLVCHGCAVRNKRDCIVVLQHEFPYFGAGTLDADEQVTFV